MGSSSLIDGFALVAALVGGLVGLAELVGRYRDAPVATLRSWPAALYGLLNAIAGAVAYFVLTSNGWKLLQSSDASGRWLEGIIAGLGAMVILRASLMSVRVGSESVSLGPGGLLQVFMAAADRAVDRGRAEVRSQIISEVMANVSFEKAKEALPTYCETLMQNLSPDALAEVAAGVKRLSDAPMSDRVRAITLGSYLLSVFGESVLREAVRSLGAEITNTGGSGPR